MKITFLEVPQPILYTNKEGSAKQLWAPNRTTASRPTLPILEAIVNQCAQSNGLEITTESIDLRDPRTGNVEIQEYGQVTLPYVNNVLTKAIVGVPLEKVIDKLKDSDVIAFSNNFAMQRNVVQMYAKQLRKIFPDKKIIFGGRDVFPSDIAESYAQSVGMRNCTLFGGHSYKSLPEFVKKQADLHADLSDMIEYDENGNKQEHPKKSFAELILHGSYEQPIPLIKDISKLARFNMSGEGATAESYDKFAHITFSMGCPHNCGYCTTGARERGQVIRTLENITAELDMYKEAGVKTLAIMDDNLLTIPRENLLSIMNEVNKRGFRIEYGNGLQLAILEKDWDELRDPILKNCTTLYMPFEDLTRQPLDTKVAYEKLMPIHKEFDLLHKVIDYFDSQSKEISRQITVGVILGVPGHTKEGLCNTAPKNAATILEQFIDKKVRVAVTPFCYIPLPGTPFGEKAAQKGMIVDIKEHPEVLNLEMVSYGPSTLSNNPDTAARIVYDTYRQMCNLNPAGRLGPNGEYLGVSYMDLKRHGVYAIPEHKRSAYKNWLCSGDVGGLFGAGMHYKTFMTKEIADQNKKMLKVLK